MSTRTIHLTDPLYDYLLASSVHEPDVLKQLRERTAQLPMNMMQISPEQGQFMYWLVATLGVKNAIEVGVFTGYSSIITALALSKGGQLIACDVSEEYTSIAREYWKKAGVEKSITLHLRPALDTLNELIKQGKQGTFDFAFIDADKVNYDHYYEAVLQLLCTGGVVVVDNVLWSGRVIDKTINDVDTVALRAFNKKLYNDKRVAISMLPVADGLTLVRKL